MATLTDENGVLSSLYAADGMAFQSLTRITMKLTGESIHMTNPALEAVLTIAFTNTWIGFVIP